MKRLRAIASSDNCGTASKLLESGAAIIIREHYKDSVRETLQMAGAEAVSEGSAFCVPGLPLPSLPVC